MQLIPLQPIASQTFQITLNGQACSLAVYAKTTPGGQQQIYVDLQLSDAPVLSCRIAQNRVLMVRYAYLGFQGDLVFVDMQAQLDPQWSGLGGRWQLVYLATADVEALT